MTDVKEIIIKNIWNLLGTAWSEFTEDEKAKFEKGWALGYDIFSKLLDAIIQRDGGFSLLTARPFYVEDKCYFSFYSTTTAAKALLDIDTIPSEQYLPKRLIYTEKFTPLYSGAAIYLTGQEFSNTEEIEFLPDPVSETIYLLTHSGFQAVDGFWKVDPLTSGYQNRYTGIYTPYDI